MSLRRIARNMLGGAREPTRSGTVVEISNTTVSVATVNGRKTYSVPDSTVYAVGDTVRYSGDTLIGRAPRIKSLPIYSV